ncbi:MAG: NERD domain-containing protein [Sphingobium sp.]|uniref:nuclease-related domain-containing protein n=1 Tax=Sphingobium sp. TaxID=1912891 RepID=UPI0029AA6D6C|nr:NERD domain-containing protein [Sphingobium sp.]MDX3911613.1 NERD domain-containing protein [Sphingobium sp.]
MILKPSTKSDELAQMTEFLDDPGFALLPASVRKAANARRRGIDGEKYTAHILDRKFHMLPDHALIHDLRIPDGIGGYAQFDHIVLSRLSRTAAIFEVKNYGGRLSRNAHDEWMVWYEGRRRPVSIANPQAQVRRQREVLREWLCANQHDKAFEQIGVFVIMPPGCDIDRKAVTSDFSVYKADNVIAEWNQFGGISPLGKLFSTGVSHGSLRAIGAQLASAHVPDGKTLHERLRIAPPAPQDAPEENTADAAAVGPEVVVLPKAAPAPQPVGGPEPVVIAAAPDLDPSATVIETPAAEVATPPTRRRKVSEPEELVPGITEKILRDGRVAFLADPGNDEAAARLAAACEGHAKWNRQYRNWLCEADAAERVRAGLLIDPSAGTEDMASGLQPASHLPANLHVEQG